MSTKKVKNRIHIVFGALKVDGKTVASLNYERVEHADGTVTERGLPPGMKPNPGVGDLLAAAFDVAMGKAKPKPKRRKKP